MMLSFSQALRRSLLKSVCVAVNGPICRIGTSLYTLPRRGSTSSLYRGAAFSWTDRFLAAPDERLSLRVNSPRLDPSASKASLLTCILGPDLAGARASDPHALLSSFFLRSGAFFFPPSFPAAGGALGCLAKLPHAFGWCFFLRFPWLWLAAASCPVDSPVSCLASELSCVPSSDWSSGNGDEAFCSPWFLFCAAPGPAPPLDFSCLTSSGPSPGNGVASSSGTDVVVGRLRESVSSFLTSA